MRTCNLIDFYEFDEITEYRILLHADHIVEKILLFRLSELNIFFLSISILINFLFSYIQR